MVLTRSQAREDQLAKERDGQELKVQSQDEAQDTSQHLSRVNTQIEIVPSATGQGKHTRWIRQHLVSATESFNSQPDVIIDERYVTPAPISFPTPSAPQKVRGISGIRAAGVSPPVWNINTAMDNIEEEPDVQVDGESSNGILGSPFSGQATFIWQPATNPRPLCLEPTILVSDEPSPVGRTDTEIADDEGLRRAFGPHGTHLYNSRGEPIFV